MKKVAIVYSSKYGHTKQYAEWLKEDVDADAIDISRFNITQMLAYKLVIFACGVYGDKLSVMDFVKKNITAIPVQKTMVMAVSWYTNDSKEAADKLIAENYPEQFKGNVPMYVVNSGMDKKAISKMDSVKLVAAKLAIEKKDGRSSDDINALGILNGYSDPTSKDNLASIKKGIEEFLNPPQPAPAPKAAAPAAKSAPAKPAPAKSAPAPAAKPASETDALANSVEEAFKHLGAKPVIQKHEPPAPEPVKETPAPAAEQTAEPVIQFNANGKVVVSSVLDAINSMNNPQPVQQAAVPKPASEPAAEVKPEPAVEVQPEPVAEAKPEPAVEVQPEPVIEAKPEPAVEVQPEPVVEVQSTPAPAAETKPEPPKKTNSYMELFAKKRRASAEEAPKAAEPAPAPVQAAVPTPAPAPIPRPEPAPHTDIDFGDLDFGTEATPAPAPAPAPVQSAPASDELDLDSYDFIGESKPAVSSRALNAVQALAKAKEEAEKEAAKKAQEQEAARNIPEEQTSPEQSEEDDGGFVFENESPADAEEVSDGLEAFEFTNDIDYDVEAELDIKFVEPEEIEPVKHESKNNLDIKKLQEEINASIESNRAAKEKMLAREEARKKEEVHNPFAVQFDEDEDKKKKKKAKKEPEPKFLEEPLDPEIFFSKANKDTSLNAGVMPEIRFKH